MCNQEIKLYSFNEKYLDTFRFNYYSAAALLAMQSAVIATAILSVRLSVCLSVTRLYPIQTNENRITGSSL